MVDLKPGKSNNAGEFNYGKEGLAKEDAIEATNHECKENYYIITHRVRSRRQVAQEKRSWGKKKAPL